MMSPDPFFIQLRTRVVAPALAALGLGDGDVAVNLVLGTAAQETGGRFLAQYPAGPALGLWQEEPATHDDMMTNFLVFRPQLAARLAALAVPGMDRADQLTWNLRYAAACCRLRYDRAEQPLPATTDPHLLGAYWKAHYNTPQGAGTVDEFVRNFQTHIGAPIHAE